MPKGFAPLLGAALEDGDPIRFPVIVSPKLDGIRCVTLPGLGAVSRTLKPIANTWIRDTLSHEDVVNLDGEIIVGKASSETAFRSTESAVMKHGGTPAFEYHVFDDISKPELPFSQRLQRLNNRPGLRPDWFKTVPQVMIHDEKELYAIEEKYLKQGYEGVMLRDPQGPYKFGRSTVNQGILLKLKRFVDMEGTIVGFGELEHNANEAKKNALGRTERSTAKEGLVGRDMLGTFAVQAIKTKETAMFVKPFNVGTGFDLAERKDFWKRQNELKGKIVKIKYQKLGSQDAPRFPVFLGFRHPDDM